MNLHVHIEELVLHGFAGADRARIADAVQTELVRLFTESGVPPALGRGGSVDRVDAGSFAADPGGRGGVTGARIAQALHGGLGTCPSA